MVFNRIITVYFENHIKSIKQVKHGEISGSHSGQYVSWDIALCSMVEPDQCCRSAYHLWHQGTLPDYTAQYPRKQSFFVSYITYSKCCALKT
jgi:hypothetical protein